MDLKIFDVEHGACALLTCDDNTRIMIDCGHNGTTQWNPGTYLRSEGVSEIEMLIITNYDEDHVSGIENLFKNISVRSLWRNTSVSPNLLRNLKSEDGMGAGIDFLTDQMANIFNGGPFDCTNMFRGLTRNAFYNNYPLFDDENNLSFVTSLECNGIGVLFPGDLEAKGWWALMQQVGFKEILAKTKVLVASHHGRQGGWCNELKDLCNPFYVVISDKGYMYDTQETLPLYRSIARGGPFRGDSRRVLTTRRDGRIGFKFNADGWWPY